MREKEELSQNKSIQADFLSQIKSVLPASASLAQELSEQLDISMDSAYRRIRGETPLTLNEAYKLAESYHISLGGLSEEVMGIVQFGYSPLSPDFKSMEDYLRRLLENLRKISKDENARILYCSQDIPVFHNVSLDRVAEFKIFYWMRSIMSNEEMLHQKFSENTIPENLQAMGREIYEEYQKIDSAELWSRSTINSTLRQIQYYWESGIFESQEEALEVLNDMRRLIEGIEKTAARGRKSDDEDSGKYEMYISEIELTTNCALVELQDISAVFLGHHTFNMLETTHSIYSDQTRTWFKNMMGKATLISSVGEKYRYQFFQDAYKKIDQLKHIMEEE